MNCPTCNQPMRTRTRTSFIEVDGKKWVYEFEEMYCEKDAEYSWQTGEQVDKELQAIQAAKAAAAKLAKHTTHKKAPVQILNGGFLNQI